MQTTETCWLCHGARMRADGSDRPCKACKGEGWVLTDLPNPETTSELSKAYTILLKYRTRAKKGKTNAD